MPGAVRPLRQRGVRTEKPARAAFSGSPFPRAPRWRHNRDVRVLIVEDEVALAQAVQDGLQAEGYDVDVVHDGNDGLWRAREGSYDAIVLDILLPGMNGYKVCETLRDEGVWTPILMLTAKDGEWDEAEALDTGADDFLSKPFSFVVLARAAARVVPPRRTAASRGARGRSVAPRPRHAPRASATASRSSSPRASSRCSSTSCGATATSRRSARSSITCGAWTSPATRTSSRCTSATCAARSTSRSTAS